MRTCVLVVGWMCLLSPGFAADAPSREQTIAALVRATGLEAMLEESRESAREQAVSLSDELMNEVLGSETQLSAEQSSAVVAASRAFIESCAASLDIKDAVAAWSRLFAAGLTDSELQQMLAYYTSPIGMKDVAASQAAMPKWEDYLASKGAERMQVSVRQFTAELERIMAMPKR